MIYAPFLLLLPMANMLRVYGGIDLLRLMYNAELMIGFANVAVCKTGQITGRSNYEY